MMKIEKWFVSGCLLLLFTPLVSAQYESQLRSIGQQADAEIAGLRQQVTALQAQLTLAESTIADQKDQIDLLRAEIVVLKARIAELENQQPPPPPPPTEDDPADAAPTIRLQPTDRTVRKAKGDLLGDTAVFAIQSTGYPTPTYQWRRNGTPISGATELALIIRDCKDSDAGQYDCVVTNKMGSVTTDTARLDVVENTGRVLTVSPGDDLRNTVYSLRAGDSIVLRGGKYDLSDRKNHIYFKKDYQGVSWARPFTISAYPGEKPVLDGRITLDTRGKWTRHSGSIWKVSAVAAGLPSPNKEYIDRQFGRGRSAKYLEMAWVNGTPVLHQLGLNETMCRRWYSSGDLSDEDSKHNGTILELDRPGEYTYDHDNEIIYLWMWDSSDPNDHDFTIAHHPLGGSNTLDWQNACGVYIQGYNNFFIVRGLTIIGTPRAPISTGGIGNVLIEDCDLSWTHANLGGEKPDYTLLSCNIHHGNYNGIQVATDAHAPGIRIIKTRFAHQGTQRNYGHRNLGGECWGINWSGTDRGIIYDCQFEDNYWGNNRGGAIVHETWGNNPDREAFQSLFEDNVFANNNTDILMQGKNGAITRQAIFRGNTSQNSREYFIEAWGANRGHFLHDNRIENTGRGAIRMDTEASGEAPSGNRIIHNTLISGGSQYDLSIRVASGNEVRDNDGP